MSIVKAPSLPVRNRDQPRLEEAAPPPSSPKVMEDLPPELLTKILELVTLDGNKKNMLGCRLVNSQWKQILDSIIENGICSGKFEAVPALNIQVVEGELKVRYLTRVADTIDPFPFKSLRLIGLAELVHNHSERSQLPLLSLPAFASRFGGNLTTFIIFFCGRLKMPINSLSAILSSMPNLKRLKLKALILDTMGEELLVIPTAPLLPNLTTLELQLPFICEKDFLLIGWLIGSYAEQLVHLQLDSVDPLPFPLRTRHQYTYSDSSGETRPILTTSESAFRNLKELRLFHPNAEFLQLTISETPALQRLCLSLPGLNTVSRLPHFDLGDVKIFIAKCSSTLETFNFGWKSEWDDEDEITNFLEEHRQLDFRVGEVAFPRLKCVLISYPCTDLQERFVGTFLLKFPSLKTLHLLCFRVHDFDKWATVKRHQIVNEVGNGNSQNDEEIVALKAQLAPLHQRMSIQNDRSTALLAELDLLIDLPEDEVLRQEVAAQEQQLDDEIERLDEAMSEAREERAAIYKRLAALGENTKEVMVQQLLERGGFWNTFPNLQTVLVSSGHKPDGDVCVVRRKDDA